MELKERLSKITIPKGSGTEGFVRSLRGILQLPRVQRIVIERGQVEFMRLAHAEEPDKPLNIDFETLRPAYIIKNTDLVELDYIQEAPKALALLFRRASLDRLYPTVFVGGTRSYIWKWFQSSGLELPVTDELYGLPFVTDEEFTDDMLFMCAAPVRGSTIVDTQRAYKILMPEALNE